MNLKEWMKESGCTHKKLAEDLGVSLALIYYWLRGEKVPSYNNMKKLLKRSNNAIDANTFYK